MSELTHFDDAGRSRMVDVGEKTISQRMAKAEAWVLMRPETLRLLGDGRVTKGNVFEIARIAGIQATKRTDELIPLCHSLGLDSAAVDLKADGENKVHITSIVKVQGRTGVEMEALTAVTVAALTVYDMCKAVDRDMQIVDVRLVEKTGGRSGHYLRNA